jgi:YrbI family 3-deoxy-D-manno-octulosonate 8-phosphate phosphatase
MLKAIVLDFDGVFTDDKVIVDETGKESVMCSRADGYGILQLKKLPIQILVLTKEINPVASARCKKMGIDCQQGIDNKLEFLIAWLERRGIDPADTIYVGNDVNDIECMEYVGESFCPIDAHPKVLDIADDVLYAGGGNGAVRELCDFILEGL